MIRLFRIVLLSVLLAGLSLQGAWAGPVQCTVSQDLQQVTQRDAPAAEAGVFHDHGGGTQRDVKEDCVNVSTVSCAGMALLPAQPAVVVEHGSSGLIPAPSLTAVLFLTIGPDRPPKPGAT